ncbi:MAG: DUF1844 domain-containing protein [bacterium]
MSEEKEREESSKGFKVEDHRRFNVDGSGKSEVAEEKPVSEEEPQKSESAGASQDQFREEPAEVSFAGLILSLAGSAQMSLGISPNPFTQKIEKDLAQAQQTIDLIGLLETKTKGNLTEEEDKLLKVVLSDLRLRFVEEKSKK